MSEFVRETEPYRRELIAHCYRMLGSAHDAEDVVQETYLRAWRGYRNFENRASVRTWLYRIATNTCLTALGHSSRRVLPSGLAGPADDPHVEPEAAPNVAWLQVIPDSWVNDPAAVVTSRESLRLRWWRACSTCQRSSGRCFCCATCWPSRPPTSPRCSTSVSPP
jgi:RNA polymerase sigma-70 factor (ECF subfamily)